MSLESTAALLAYGDTQTRASVAADVQRTRGNAFLQRLVDGESERAETQQEGLGERILANEGRGAALDPRVRAHFEGLWGADLSAVRLHADMEANGLAGAVEAVAFTSGQDIFFRSGTYAPTSPEGFGVLAHELAHTVQQASGPVSGTETPGRVRISDPSDGFEQDAERAAAAALTAGDHAPLTGGAAAAGRAGAGATTDVPTSIQREEDKPWYDSAEYQAATNPFSSHYFGQAAELTGDLWSKGMGGVGAVTGAIGAYGGASTLADEMASDNVSVSNVIGGGLGYFGGAMSALGGIGTLLGGSAAAAGAGAGTAGGASLLAAAGPVGAVVGAGALGFGATTLALEKYGDAYLNRPKTEEIDEEESIAAFEAQQRGETTLTQDLNNWLDTW